MPSPKFEAAAYAIVQHIKDGFAKNVAGAHQWQRVPDADKSAIASLIYGSVDQGYHEALPRLVEVHEDSTADRDGFFTLPESLLDVVVDVISRARAGKEKVAAFTIVRDEPFFLPRWLKYYGNFLGEGNLYVLDNGSTDGSIEEARRRFFRANFVPLPSAQACDWQFITASARCFQRALLRGYQAVLFSDVDEFIVTRAGEGLYNFCRDFLRNPDALCVGSEGWGIVQQEGELPLDDYHFLSDRTRLWRAPGYDKVLLSKVPLDWSKGQHVLNTPARGKVDGLALLHARDADVDVFWKQCQRSAGRSPSFQSASSRDQVERYFRTRKPEWADFGVQYTERNVDMPRQWRTQMGMSGT